jgi:hypothetical protein
MDEQIFKGGHGDIYRGHKIRTGKRNNEENLVFVLKRMNTMGRPHIKRCAIREAYFGEVLHDVPNTPRFITHFETDQDHWLVFRYEGISLQQVNIFIPSFPFLID